MGKRKYLDEQNELRYMGDFFADSIQTIYAKQNTKLAGNYVEYENQKKFKRLVYFLNNFIEPETCSEDVKEKIENGMSFFCSRVFKSHEMGDFLFKQFVERLVAYCWTRKKVSKEKWFIKKHEKYSELNDAFNQWTRYSKILNAKIFFQNVKTIMVEAKTKLANVFTR